MPRNTSVTLGPHFEGFVDQLVHQGHYHSVSEVIRAGLRLLEEQELRVQQLREALIAGEQSGAAVAFDRKSLGENSQEPPVNPLNVLKPRDQS